MSPALIKIIVSALALAFFSAAGYALVSTYNGAIEKREQAEARARELETSLHEQITENARMSARNQVIDAVLSDRQKLRQAAADLERKADEAVSKVLASSRPAADWWNAPVPVELRGAGAAGHVKNEGGTATSKPVAAKPGS